MWLKTEITSRVENEHFEVNRCNQQWTGTENFRGKIEVRCRAEKKPFGGKYEVKRTGQVGKISGENLEVICSVMNIWDRIEVLGEGFWWENRSNL